MLVAANRGERSGTHRGRVVGHLFIGLGGWTSSRLAGLQKSQSFGYPIELCSVVLIVDTRSPQPRRTGAEANGKLGEVR